MNLFQKIFPKKATTPGAIGAFVGLFKPTWSVNDFETYAREGYQQNVYVYASIRQIALACSGIPWLAYSIDDNGDKTEIPAHPVYNLLRRPGPRMGWSLFQETAASSILISGNLFIYAPTTAELQVLRPDWVTIKKNADARTMGAQPILGYTYRIGGQTVDIAYEDMLHIRTYNPLDEYFGMPPLQAAARPTDQNNAARAWNTGLLQNGAKPSGILYTDAELDEDYRDILKNDLRKGYAGYTKSGLPMVLEGGLKWQQLSMSPIDMNWLDGMHLSAREIATAFGVPPELIGDSANKTYNNYKEARKALYDETILPWLDRLAEELNNWLMPKFRGSTDITLSYDADQIEALQSERSLVWDWAIRGTKSGIVTPNEARDMLGYQVIAGEEHDSLYMPSNMVPIKRIYEGTAVAPKSPAPKTTMTPPEGAAPTE